MRKGKEEWCWGGGCIDKEGEGGRGGEGGCELCVGGGGV
jgi:hypothetical protein